MGRHAEAKPFRVGHGSAKGFDRVLWGTDVGAGSESTAGGHDLDAVCTELELTSYRSDYLICRVSLRAEHVAVTAGGGDRSAGHDHPGAGNDALFDSRLDRENYFVAASEVAHGCDP